MVCEDGRCKVGEVVDPDPGGLGDACDDDKPCGDHEGKALECKDGTCQESAVGCPAGTLDCPCGEADACDALDGVQLECKDGTCQEPGDTPCPAGTLGCPCGDGDTCDGSLECKDGECAAPPGAIVGLQVGNGDVRACGLVIEMADVTVSFEANATGRTRRDGDRLAISFTAKEDKAFDAALGTILGADGQPASMAGVTPTKVECFDRKGVAVADPDLQLQ